MAELNEAQFSKPERHVGSEWEPADSKYSGQRGEPAPDEYTHHDDWQKDHKRWQVRTEAGKPYVSQDYRTLKREAKEREAPLVEEGKKASKERRQTIARARMGIAASKRIRRRFK